MDPMSTSDWILVWSTITLGAAAIFGPAWADRFKSAILKPELHVDLFQQQPDCHLTKIRVPVISPARTAPCYVYRLRVENRGKAQARKCEVVIESLAVADAAGRYVPHASYTPVRLVWGSGNDGAFVDANPHRPFYCDFFKIPAADSQKVFGDFGGYTRLPDAAAHPVGLVLDVAANFYSQPNWLGPGRYRFDLAVHSENAAITRKSLYVSWSGAWRDSLEGMFRECVVTSSKPAS